MLILISVDVQCLQNVVFSFEKGSNGQNHLPSGSDHPIKIPPPPEKFPNPLEFHPLTIFGIPDMPCP